MTLLIGQINIQEVYYILFNVTGKQVLLKVAGKDGTKLFEAAKHPDEVS